MDLAEHARIMWRRRWVILALSVLIAASAGAVSAKTPTTYQASSVLNVSSSIGQSNGQDNTLFLTRSYAALAKTNPVVTAARSSALVAGQPEASSGDATVTPDKDVGLLTVTATGRTREAARRYADGMAAALVSTVVQQNAQQLKTQLAPIQRKILDLQSQLGTVLSSSAQNTINNRLDTLQQAEANVLVSPAGNVAVVSRARDNPGTDGPHPLRNALLAFLVAFIVAAEITVAVAALSDRLSSGDVHRNVHRATKRAVLAEVPHSLGPPALESIRALCAQLLFSGDVGPRQTVALVSATRGAGCTFLASHLATTLASSDMAAVLVDGDLRNPRIHELYDIPRAPGLSDVLIGAGLANTVQHLPDGAVVPAGSARRDPGRLLLSPSFRRVLAELAATGLVIVDTPAAASAADALTIAAQCDAVMLVVDPQTSRRDELRKTAEALQRVGANVVGVVLNHRTAAGGGPQRRWDSVALADPAPARAPGGTGDHHPDEAAGGSADDARVRDGGTSAIGPSAPSAR
jgi:capsular exopolysaccharide synthesis family protein